MTVQWQPRYCYSFGKKFLKGKKKNGGKYFKRKMCWLGKNMWVKVEKICSSCFSRNQQSGFFQFAVFYLKTQVYMFYRPNQQLLHSEGACISLRAWKHSKHQAGKAISPPHHHLLFCTGSTAELFFPTLYLTLECKRDFTAIFRLDTVARDEVELKTYPIYSFIPISCRLTWTCQSPTFQACVLCWNILIYKVELRNWLL